MTNKKVSRTTVTHFIHPAGNCFIEPAKALASKDSGSPPLFKSFAYKDFLPSYVQDTHAGVPPLDRHKIQAWSVFGPVTTDKNFMIMSHLK